MGNTNTLSADSLSNGSPQTAAAQNTFHNTRFHESPIRDAGMAAEISSFIKSQILCQTNTAIYAHACALNSPVLSMRGFG